MCVPEYTHPIKVAERTAVLDILSGGRLEVGTGRSATWCELGGFRAQIDNTKKSWDEYIHAIPKMWMQERFAHQGRLAPITVYRALDFLRDNGLVHRIESRNAFVACVHHHAGSDPVVFLICERCGAVGEATGGAMTEALKASCRAAGFVPKSPVIEIAGICSHCRG